MKMQMFNYVCRKAKASDDAASIAKYIHLTDPYIYPSICADPEDASWVTLIAQCLKTRDNVFSMDHISVVLYRNRIIGIACVVPCGKQLNFSEKISIPEALQSTLAPAIAGYFDPLIAESENFTGYNIVNFCIDPQYHGKGVGTMFMLHCIREYGTHPIHLDVVASNKVAVRLYEKAGFRIKNEYLGFSGSSADLPCYHMLYTPKTAE